MDYNNYSGNNPRFSGQPQHQFYAGGMPYFQQQGFANQRPIIQQQNMQQYGYVQHQQTQGFQGGFVQGQFPRNPNPQMQQAFNQQQHQKMIEQQHKMAQETQKLQNEVRKKREFEMQQKRLQEFSRPGAGKKAGGGDLSHLIGSLADKGGGSKPVPKQHLTTSSGRSIFARPGGSYQAPHKQDSSVEDQQHHLQSNTSQVPGQPQDVQHCPGQIHTQPPHEQLGISQHPGLTGFPQYPGQPHTQPPTGQTGFSQHLGQQHTQPQHPGQTGFSQYPGQQHTQPQHPGQPHTQPTPGQTGFSQYPGQQHTQPQHPGQSHAQPPSGQTGFSQYPGQQHTQPQHHGQPHAQPSSGQTGFSQNPGQQHTQPPSGQTGFSQYPGQQNTQPQNPRQPHTQPPPGQTGFSQYPGQQHTQPQNPGQPHTQPPSGQTGFSQYPGQQHTQPQNPEQASFPQHSGQQFTQPSPGQTGIPQHPGPSCTQPQPGQTGFQIQQQAGFQNQQSGFSTQTFDKGPGAVDDEFSDFQEAQPSFSGQSSIIPGQGCTSLISSSVSSASGPPAWPNQSEIRTQNYPSWQMSHATSIMGTSYNSNQIVSGNTTTVQATPVMSSGFGSTGPRGRTDSQSSISSTSSGGFLSSQAGNFGQTQYQPSLSGMQATSFVGQEGPIPGPVMPGIPGQEQLKQHSDVPGQVVPGSDGGDIQEEPEDAVKLLYGIDLPDWCTTGIDLPGVYKDVKDAVTMNGAIDTGKLYTVLLTSELHRDILGQMWSRVNKATLGQLNDMELRMMLGLIALGQTGLKVERLTLEKLATCKSAPIPSFPEDVFKSQENSWSFQKELEKDKEERTSDLPVCGSYVGWQSHPSSNHINAPEPNDKYSAFRMDSIPTSIPNASTKETTGSVTMGSWSLAGNSHMNSNQQVNVKATPEVGQVNLATKLSNSPEFQGFQSVVNNSEVDDDFGDFQGSVSSLDSTGQISQQSGQSGVSRDVGSDSSSKLAASLEDFKLKRDTQEQTAFEFSQFESFSSAEAVTSSKTAMSSHGGGSHGDGSHSDGSHKTKSNSFVAFPNKMPPQSEAKPSISFPNIPKPTPSLNVENEKKIDSGWGTKAENSPAVESGNQEDKQVTVDKYSFLRDLDTPTVDNTFSQSSRKKDDSFEDFEGFESTTTSQAADDFGDFQTTTTESPAGNQNLGSLADDKNSQGWGFGGPSMTQSSKAGDFASFENAQLPGHNVSTSDTSGRTQPQDDFGEFADFQSSTSTAFSSGVMNGNDMPSLSSLNSNFNQDMSGQPKNNFTDEARQRSSSTTSNSFSTTIPLDSTQRYKLLSDEGEDMEKHDNVWGRCLNSCLLTLVTGALAVQKISDAILKQEVLQSKKGIEYFTALTEVFKVTQRIQVSLMKTEFANNKLKDILVEINQSWKNISNFLAGSNIETNVGNEDFSAHHIQTDEDKSIACGVCLLNVNKSTTTGTDTKISYGGRDYHATCANFWCNRVDSILPKLLPVNSLI